MNGECFKSSPDLCDLTSMLNALHDETWNFIAFFSFTITFV